MRPGSRIIACLLAMAMVVALTTNAVAVPERASLSTYVVSVESRPSRDLLDRVAANGARTVLPLSVIDAVIIRASEASARSIARLDGVRGVQPAGTAQYLGYQSDRQTGARKVREGTAPLPRALSGAGVTVAVVDTGIAEVHPDLEGRVVDHLSFDLLPQVAGLLDSDQRDAFARHSATTNPGRTAGALSGHGTLVAGVVAGTGRAAKGGIDMRMAATGVHLVDYNTGGISYDTLSVVGRADASIFLLAYDHMIRHRNDPQYPGGIRVAVNSWGLDPNQPYAREAFSQMLTAAMAAGIVPVFAAGNTGAGDGDTVLAPQNAIADLVTVGISCPAEDGLDLPAGRVCGEGDLSALSSHGPAVDVVAPMAGVWVPTVWAPGPSTVGAAVFGRNLPGLPPPRDDPAAAALNRMQYTQIAGTSMAAPYIGGVVALMLEANPLLTPAVVENLLAQTAQDFGPLGRDTGWGEGEVEVFDAVVGALRTQCDSVPVHLRTCTPPQPGP